MPITDSSLLGVDQSIGGGGGHHANGGSSILTDEDASMCLLLPATPSPPPMDFVHPLTPVQQHRRHHHAGAGDGGGGGGVSDDGSSADVDAGCANGVGGGGSGLGGDGADARAETSSSSGSSGIGMDVPIAGTTTLYNNKNVYQNLDNNGETFQQNGTKQYANLNIQITKDTPGFVHWNWPLIRQCSFWAFMAGILAMVVVVVAMIVALPRACDPPTPWYNGGVFYEIFPASYQDSNDDGIGDLNGIRSRVDYLQQLGVTAVRLNSIFAAPNYPDDFRNVTDLRRIDPRLGNQQHLAQLAGVLHSRNMSLVLDLPIHPLLDRLPIVVEEDPATNKGLNPPNDTSSNDGGGFGAIAAARSKRTSPDDPNPSPSDVLAAMQLWLSLGVDGFYVQGLEHYHNDPHLLANVRQWKRQLGAERILIVGEKLLDKVAAAAEQPPTVEDVAADSLIVPLQQEQKPNLRDALLTVVDLVDVSVDVRHGAESIDRRIAAVVAGPLMAAGVHRAQVHWSLVTGAADDKVQGSDGLRRRRIASQHSPNTALAATLMALTLPGTPSILYGDEIGMRDAHDPHDDHVRAMHYLAPMAWAGDKKFTVRQAHPWQPAGAGEAEFRNRDAVAALVGLRRRSPTLYLAAIEKRGKKAQANTALRHGRNDVLVVERWYPRRKSFVAITNFGKRPLRLDLSALFYGGVVAAGTGRDERVLFKDFAIGAEETVVVMLDK